MEIETPQKYAKSEHWVSSGCLIIFARMSHNTCSQKWWTSQLELIFLKADRWQAPIPPHAGGEDSPESQVSIFLWLSHNRLIIHGQLFVMGDPRADLVPGWRACSRYVFCKFAFYPASHNKLTPISGMLLWDTLWKCSTCEFHALHPRLIIITCGFFFVS